MAMRDLINGGGTCAVPGSSSSNPIGALANVMFDTSNKAEELKGLPSTGVSVPESSPDFRPDIPLSAIPGSEFEAQQSRLPDARSNDFLRGFHSTDHAGFVDAWDDVQRPPVLPPHFSGSEARFNEFERIYDAPPVQPTWDVYTTMAGSGNSDELDAVRAVVLKPSETLDEQHFVKINGYDFNHGLDLTGLLNSMASTGFQASSLGDAITVVNQMLDWRLSHEKPVDDSDCSELDPAYRESVKCKIFLGFTSNLVSSGIRDVIRFLTQHRMVDVIVTTTGGIEEDLIKCLAPTYRGEFSLPGAQLRSKGLNRIGNLLVPNDNYCKFENWIMPLLDCMLIEQSNQNLVWTPSKVIARLGKEINDETSYLYWAYKNGIPVYCPALTDGSLGDMIYCHSVRNPGLVIDIVQDIRSMNGEAVHTGLRKTGVIILGGGLPKHHICNANMMCNGADYAVYINTAQEFDGSDSGAQPDEAVSWGKIKGSAKPIKVHCDATIAFPLLVAATFAKRFHDGQTKNIP